MSYEPLPPHLDPRGKHRGASHAPGSSVARPIGRVLGALLSLSLLLLAGYYYKTYRDINNNVPRLKGLQVNQAPSGGAGDIDGKDQNILLVGNDDRSNMTAAEIKVLHAGESSGSLATDTMIIIHVPADGSKATLISIPRDSYVDIKGFGMGKVNGAYADAYYHGDGITDSSTLEQRRTAGANLLVSTLQDLTGLTINHYVQIDLLGFYRISNAIGGVTVNLCHAVDDSHAANVAAGLSGGSGLVLSAGKHVIKGVTALEFVRQRHFLPRGDLDRVRRQQYFLTAAFRQVASVGILTKLRSLGDAVEKSVYLDPTLNLTDLGSQLQNLSANNIVSKTIPTTNATIDGQDVLQVNTKRVQAFIDKLINPRTRHAVGQLDGVHAGQRSSTAGSATSSAPAPIDSKCIN